MNICARCGARLLAYPIDYCAACGKELCDRCMDEGCCGRVPAASGLMDAEDEDEEGTET
jgi:hypothetical protein